MEDTDRLTRLFKLQGSLQERLGYDFGTMDSRALIEYIKLNILALTGELHEALGETNWKPWAAAVPGFKDRERYVEEIADATHFLLNLCLAGMISADELMAAYEGKNAVNHKRQDDGYTGHDKCARRNCSRSLDDPLAVHYHSQYALERFCSAACAAEFALEWERSGGGEPEADD